MSDPTKAFVLGAGLGTRLRPLTERLPKTLIPVWDRPLITYAFDHLISAGAHEFVVNTHWHPQAYGEVFPSNEWRGAPITFRHEPVLLETGGGIANVADFLRDEESFWVYNGDTLATLPLLPVIAQHRNSNAIVTLVLRRSGPQKVVAIDEATGRVLDIKNLLGTGAPAALQFTGIYLCRREFLDWLRPGIIESSVRAFLEIIRRTGRLSGVIMDEGQWIDLGDRSSYIEAHRRIGRPPGGIPCLLPGVELRGICALSPQAVISSGAVLEDSIVWRGANVAADAHLTRCIVRTGETASGRSVDRDF
ncbi:MAG: sugar phosphate nucleotidyltransferase [Verrucomicrobiales bacterium]